MKFNHYIAQRLPELQWRHFGVGALQAYLFEGDGYEQRIHIWHPSLVAPGIQGAGDVHNHRFSFTSLILCGMIEDARLNIEEAPEGTWDIYRVVNAREQKANSGSYDGNVSLSHRANVIMNVSDSGNYIEGDTYEFPRGAFHATRAHGTTVTLVTKYDVKPGQRAEIAVPHGKTLIHAFDESRVVDINSIVAVAQAKLSL